MLIGFFSKPKIKDKELFEVQEGTTTADGSDTGEVCFSSNISEIFILNLTDTDTIKFREINEDNETSHWKSLPQGLKWASLLVPDDTIKIAVKHTTEAQEFEIWGSRFLLRGYKR